MKSIAGAILIHAGITAGGSWWALLSGPLLVLGAGYIIADWIGPLLKKS